MAAVAAPFGRDLEADFATVGRLIGEARAAGVRLLALPEACLGGYLAHLDGGTPGDSEGGPPALDPDGPEIRRLARMAGDLVVCAGYDRMLTAPVLDAFPDAILNVHPSLLPAFAGGMHAVEDALAFGAKVSGCTVQLLEPGEPDGGPIVLQAAVPVEEDDDAESLRLRIHEQEWRILPEAVALFCSGRLHRDGRRRPLHRRRHR